MKFSFILILIKHRNEHSGGRRGTDNAGKVRAYGMHEQMVCPIILETFHLRNPCRHGNSGDSCRADNGIHLFFQKKIHDFDR